MTMMTMISTVTAQTALPRRGGKTGSRAPPVRAS
jgi:hypothetical protein